MKVFKNTKGFTLVELVIVVAVIAILVTLALPSYSAYVRKANRAEAQKLLLNWANLQEIWRANNPTYATTTNIAAPTHGDYTFTISNISSSTYTLTATAPNGTDQAKDQDKGQSCKVLTLNQSGVKGPVVSSETYCWGD